MTATNENGQVYWTFEELDLVSEALFLKKILDGLRTVRNYLVVVKTYDELVVDEMYSNVVDQIKLLRIIISNIQKLFTESEEISYFRSWVNVEVEFDEVPF